MVHAEPNAAPEGYQDELGSDLTLIDWFLAMTPAERLAAWQSAATAYLAMGAHVELQPERATSDSASPRR